VIYHDTMPTEATREFEQAWAELHPAFRRGLELAYQSLAGGGLACGAALTDAGDRIVAEGRNRAYDDPGGPDPLQGTPLAHAELNLLALVRTGWDLGPCTLWSTQEPCSMCAMAASFTGVGQVRYLAPDPWALATQPQDRRLAASAATERSIGPADDDRWVVSANVLFLHSVASRSGLTHTTVARNLELEPETTGIVVDLMSEGLTAAALTRGRPLTVALSPLWNRITAAATARTRRRSP
jgi:tRNA(Arg) A34 adenosine deaminase TadA